MATSINAEIRCYVIISMIILQCTTGDRSIYIDHTRREFIKDGQPFRYIAGEMHYFRVPRQYWKDRLHKIKMAGLNAVAFYIEWSGHEPEPGVYNFEGDYDLDAFLKEIKNYDLLAVAKPGPYICGERDNGGFPYWLLRDRPSMKYRTSDKNYLAAVDRWFGKILPLLAQHLYKNGGTIFAVQVENEYGHYKKCDKAYMEHLLTVMEKHMGKDVVYFRANFPFYEHYACDKVRDILVAGNFPDHYNVSRVFAVMESVNPKPAPMVVVEYYTGWMDYWGWAHNFKTRTAVMNTFKLMIKRNASVTFYMFAGGTNFGFKSSKDHNHPITTSYDYGAPIAEHGDIRPIYYDIHDLVTKYLGTAPKGELPRNQTKLNVGNVQLNDYISLEDVMNHFRGKNWLNSKKSSNLLTFKAMNHDYGFMFYRTTVAVYTYGTVALYLNKLRDRAYVQAGGKQFIYYNTGISEKSAKLTNVIPAKKGDQISILVENMGRESYGAANHDPKGLTIAYMNGYLIQNWIIEAVPINKNRDITEILHIVQRRGGASVPGFFHGTFKLKEGEKPADTFLNPSGWIKGFAFINGINLGRYWPVSGPQITLYVPGVYLKPHPEENRLMLFETEGAPANRTVALTDKAILDADIEFPRP